MADQDTAIHRIRRNAQSRFWPSHLFFRDRVPVKGRSRLPTRRLQERRAQLQREPLQPTRRHRTSLISILGPRAPLLLSLRLMLSLITRARPSSTTCFTQHLTLNRHNRFTNPRSRKRRLETPKRQQEATFSILTMRCMIQRTRCRASICPTRLCSPGAPCSEQTRERAKWMSLWTRRRNEDIF